MRAVSYVRCIYQQKMVAQIIDSKKHITALVFLQLVHGEDSHVTGLFRLHKELLAKSLKISYKVAECAITDLVDLGIIEHDKEDSLVYIVNEWIRQQGKHGTGVVNSLPSIRSAERHSAQHISSPVGRQFIADYDLNVDLGEYPKSVPKPKRGWTKTKPGEERSEGPPEGPPQGPPEGLHLITSSSSPLPLGPDIPECFKGDCL